MHFMEFLSQMPRFVANIIKEINNVRHICKQMVASACAEKTLATFVLDKSVCHWRSERNKETRFKVIRPACTGLIVIWDKCLGGS